MGKTGAKKTTPITRSSLETSPSLVDLAREQGVKPVSDLDELGALWPADDDPDAFLAFVQAERAAGRAAVRAKPRKSA
jgi:hypothetical protein